MFGGDLNEYHDKALLIFHSNLIRSRIYLLFLYLGDPNRFFCGCSVPGDQWEIGKRCSVRVPPQIGLHGVLNESK